jgi:hypothetical protein
MFKNEYPLLAYSVEKLRFQKIWMFQRERDSIKTGS